MAARALCAVAALALLAAAHPALADTTSEDAFVAGYAAAVLEREFNLSAPSLRVENGVIRLSAADLAGADRARVLAALGGIRHAARVEIVEDATPAPAPPAAPAPGPAPPLRILEEWQVGPLPGGSLFRPL